MTPILPSVGSEMMRENYVGRGGGGVTNVVGVDRGSVSSTSSSISSVSTSSSPGVIGEDRPRVPHSHDGPVALSNPATSEDDLPVTPEENISSPDW